MKKLIAIIITIILAMPQPVYALRPAAAKTKKKDLGVIFQNTMPIPIALSENEVRQTIVGISDSVCFISGYRICGTGFIFGQDETNIYILTAEHNFEKFRSRDEISIIFSEDRTVKADIIYGDVSKINDHKVRKFSFFGKEALWVKLVKDIAILAVKKSDLTPKDIKEIKVLQMHRGSLPDLAGNVFSVWKYWVLICHAYSKPKYFFLQEKQIALKFRFHDFAGYSGSPVVTTVNGKPYFVGLFVFGTDFIETIFASGGTIDYADVYALGPQNIKACLKEAGLADVVGVGLDPVYANCNILAAIAAAA